VALSRPTLLVIGLILLDVILVLAHVIHDRSAYLDNSMFSIKQDRGLGELFQYGKEIALILMFGWLVARRRQHVYLGWLLLFMYLLIDDAFRIHETVGDWLQDYVGRGRIWVLNVRDLGKLIPTGIVAAAVLAIVGPAFRSKSAEVRATTLRLVILMGVLAFFGVALDIFDVLFSAKVNHLIGIVEDGGEMVVMSLFVLCVAQIMRRGHDAGGKGLPVRNTSSSPADEDQD
jgi:hypothetical protein